MKPIFADSATIYTSEMALLCFLRQNIVATLLTLRFKVQVRENASISCDNDAVSNKSNSSKNACFLVYLGVGYTTPVLQPSVRQLSPLDFRRFPNLSHDIVLFCMIEKPWDVVGGSRHTLNPIALYVHA